MFSKIYKNGTYKTWYNKENTKLNTIETWKYNKLHGRYIKYYYTSNERNNIMYDMNYKYGKLCGSFIKYYDTLDGHSKIMYHTRYLNGKENGLRLSYNDNGILLLQNEYIDGNKNGHQIYYHTNGKKYIISYYKDNQLNGPMIKYFNNNNNSIQEKSNYNNNVLKGILEKWNKNGIKLCDEYYENGKFLYRKDYDINGKIIVD